MRPLLSIFLFLSCYCITSLACTLCPLRVPPRPRPLNQYKRPDLPDISLEHVPKFCNFSKTLPVAERCRRGFESIFCSADRMIDTISCPGSESPSECSQCVKQNRDNKWIVKWFDSLGKPAAGVSDGNYYWLGDYEQCQDLIGKKEFKGQYCRMRFEVPDAHVEFGCPQTDPLAIVLGACLPADCSADQLTSLTQVYSNYPVKVDCELDVSWSAAAYVMLGITFMWMGIQIVATFIQWYSESNSPFLRCLSLIQNAGKALSTKREHEFLHALHGLEFITFFVLILGNIYSYMLPYIENVAFAFEGVSSVTMHPINNYSYHIDGLFALSAFYTTFLLYQYSSQPLKIHIVIKKRLTRFWPSYIFCVLFMWLIFANVSSGPMWIHSDTVERCQHAWWKNIIFISNFFPVKDTCVDVGYVISMEAQFFVLLTVMIYCTTKYLRPVVFAAYAILLASIFFTFIRVYGNYLPPAPMLTAEPIAQQRMESYLNLVLTSSFCRIGPYMVGFLFGVGTEPYQVLVKDIDLKISKYLFGGLCFFSGMYVMFSLLPFAASSAGSPFFLALYSSIHRPLWAFSLLSFLYICHKGGLVWIDSLLSWRVFSPLSKLTWIALIVCEPVAYYFFSALNRPSYATHWSTMYAAVSAAWLCYLVAFLLDIFLSRPIRALLSARPLDSHHLH